MTEEVRIIRGRCVVFERKPVTENPWTENLRYAVELWRDEDNLEGWSPARRRSTSRAPPSGPPSRSIPIRSS